MNAKEIKESIETGGICGSLARLYGSQSVELQKKRYTALAKRLERMNGPGDFEFFSAPGRTELGGNHTDHNMGRVLAAGIQLDTLGVASKTDSGTVEIESEGFEGQIRVSLDDLDPKKDEVGHPASLVRGIASRFSGKGYAIGGFRACVSSTVPIGGGLSSSASFEVLVATILSSFYNEGKIPGTKLALICQYAENKYFGKPCGLMDQLASVLGGIVEIDFRDPQNPQVKKLEVDFGEAGLSLVILGTGGHHADLTHEYAAIPLEMKSVASVLGKRFLAEVDPEELVSAIPRIRGSVGDRALLRAFHFLGDTERVRKQSACLRAKDIHSYLTLVNESGSSSWRFLQNCYPPMTPSNQGISLALALTERFLEGEGASRVHGSGFGGAIQAYIPIAKLAAYKKLMERIFEEGCMIPLMIRNSGACRVR
jgi:galactokinase